MRFYSFSLMSICLAILFRASSADLNQMKSKWLAISAIDTMRNKPQVKTLVSAELGPVDKLRAKTVELNHNKSPEKTVEHMKNKSPEESSFHAKKAIFTGVLDEVKEKVNPRVKIVHKLPKDGADVKTEWNCAKFEGQNAESCRKWEKIESELKNNVEINYIKLLTNGLCSKKVLGKIVLKISVKNALNIAKGSNGKDRVKLEEAPLTQEECKAKLREEWEKLKDELEEQVNLSADEMERFHLGHEELKDSFPVDKSELMVELVDKSTKKQMTYLKFEEIAGKVIKNNEEFPLPEKKIKEETKDEWRKVAKDLGDYETIIVNNSMKAAHSQQPIMLSYKFNNEAQPNMYKLLAMAKKIKKLIEEKSDLALILPPKSDGFHGLKKNWQQTVQQN